MQRTKIRKYHKSDRRWQRESTPSAGKLDSDGGMLKREGREKFRDREVLSTT